MVRDNGSFRARPAISPGQVHDEAQGRFSSLLRVLSRDRGVVSISWLSDQLPGLTVENTLAVTLRW